MNSASVNKARRLGTNQPEVTTGRRPAMVALAEAAQFPRSHRNCGTQAVPPTNAGKTQ